MICTDYASVAVRLAKLYSEDFGGKASGRYRIPEKILRDMMGRRRLYETDILALQRAMSEEGYVLIDMDNFFVVMSANSFVNYRRVSKDALD
ncbi:hypothetical protein [Pseudoprimorskyibacter insulae]|uniref:Uncharacterized protein n=1 Tax=Pseudoprimorskyibacter insulae TaxID=1695997 RepID=A0A2R8B083_9RHOB|nr:hypothetical protein [Pseudoprimorskyibacter insulae]SPF81673.1 hypothetical protein PRI8871_03498 [Pseudoprimorskyibacter insulae]